MAEKAGNRPAEIFGYLIWNHSEEAQNIRERHWCPFLDRRCDKKSRLIDFSLEGGEVRAYQFTVPAGVSSLETRLYTSNGVPAMVLRVGSLFPNPGAATTISGAGSGGTDTYGYEGGQTITAANGDAKTNLITVANPSNGVYTVMVKARALSANYPNATYTLGVRALNYIDVAFDGGLAVVTNHAPNTWHYYRVEDPTNTLGWGLRLLNVTAGLPKLVVLKRKNKIAKIISPIMATMLY